MFAWKDIDTLLSHEDGPCVSIYLQTARRGPDTRRNPIALRNGYDEARAKLRDVGVDKKTCDAILAPFAVWRDDDELHQHLDDGMAIFLAPDFSRYLLAPEPFNLRVAVDDAFHLRPLLPLLARDGRFAVLTLDREHVRLFSATRHGIREWEADLPESWHKLRGMTDYEKQTGFHPTGPTPSTTGMPAARHHSYGESPAEVREAVTNEFVRSVAKALEDAMAQQSDTPLVLCAGPRLAGMFREHYSGPGLVDGHIDANPEGLDEDEIHARAYALVEPILRSERDREADRLQALLGDGSDRASTQIESVVAAAAQGRVSALFVARDVARWGQFDSERQRAMLHEGRKKGDIDLLELAARETLRNGGRIFTPLHDAMPSGAALAATYRY